MVVAGCGTEQAGEKNEKAVAGMKAPANEATKEKQKEVSEKLQKDESEETGENGAEAFQVNKDDWSVEAESESASGQKHAMLTFDDVPDAHTEEMAETLKEHDVPAIFFVNGVYLEEEEGREALRKIDEMGFAIGNHTTNHSELPALSEEEQQDEIQETTNLIEEVTGSKPEFFRAPYGSNTNYSDEYVSSHGMVKMNWTFGYDTKPGYREPEALAEQTVETDLLGDGANILMHDRGWTEEALPDIITKLENRNYDFVDPDDINGPI